MIDGTPLPVSKPVVDGFVKRPKHHAAVPVARGGTLQKNTVQHSKTLMRSAVKKPLHPLKKADVTHAAPAKLITKQLSPKPVITPRTAVPPPYREKHALDVKKSPMVQKFGVPQMPAAVTPKVAPLAVQPTPPVAPPASQMAPKSKTADLLDRALDAAQGHMEPFHDTKKPVHKRIAKKIGLSSKTMTISTTILAGLLLGGFYAYQNVPNLAMHVAAARAGFSANMPSYAPSGFSFKGPVQYSAGHVVVSFKSNSDNRAYKLTQQTSSWTSDSLLNNYVAAGGKEYQTYQDRGRTIYIYDGSSATWVNGGIWYQIEGKSDLSSDQLVRIAASL